MSRRPTSLFRGSELPRLLLLAAIVLAGWPMIVRFGRPRADERAAPPPVPAARVEPVVADAGVEFQALIDRTPMKFRDNAALALLLRRAREGPAVAGRTDVLFTHLWERPERYRGVPIHLEGVAKRVLTYEVNPALAPGGRLYEAWIYSDENTKFPYVVTFEEPPAGLTVGPDLYLRVSVDGFFLKLLRYEAGDTPRAAPLLVGRLHLTPALAAAPPPMVELLNFSRREGFVLVFVLLLVYLGFRVLFQVRRALAPSRALKARPDLPEERRADEVVDWLENLPAEEVEEDPASSPTRDDPPRHGRR